MPSASRPTSQSSYATINRRRSQSSQPSCVQLTYFACTTRPEKTLELEKKLELKEADLITWAVIIGGAAVYFLVWRADNKHAFLYRTFGCDHCQNNPCTCVRCQKCNHFKGYSRSGCINCGWRDEPPPPTRQHDLDPIPVQPKDWSGLSPGSGSFGHGI